MYGTLQTSIKKGYFSRHERTKRVNNTHLVDGPREVSDEHRRAAGRLRLCLPVARVVGLLERHHDLEPPAPELLPVELNGLRRRGGAVERHVRGAARAPVGVLGLLHGHDLAAGLEEVLHVVVRGVPRQAAEVDLVVLALRLFFFF